MRRKIITILITGVMTLTAITALAGDPVPGLDITIEQIPGGEVSSPNTGDNPAKEIPYVRFEDLEGETEAISAPGTGDTPQPATGKIKILTPERKVSTPDTGDTPKETGTSIYKTVELTGKAFGVDEEGMEVINKAELIEAIASSANIAKTNAEKVIDALMKVSPAFIIDENGLQESRNKAVLVEAIASNANLTIADAKGVLDAFVGATTKSLKGGDRVALVGFGSFSISKRKARTGRITYQNITLERGAFHDTAMNAIRNIRAAAPEERENLKEELKVSRGTFQTEILSMSLTIRENAKELRENFREKTESLRERVRIAAAHGKGLRMLNRFRSASARFDHILGRLESRVEKLEARGVDVSSVIPLIEEAKNMSVVNESKMEELKVKYESLLEGENPRGIGEEARQIAQELKAETKTLYAKLREIADEIKVATGNYNSSLSNKDK